jgi:threonine/homoserine/homoserine lactone efflux protein
MLDSSDLVLFLAAAIVVAVTPGPAILYVAARTLAGGRDEGLASSFGTGLGGLAHVAAGALGVSALVMASAEAFTVLKLAGAGYLIWLGIKTIREARIEVPADVHATGAGRAFREGVVVEALNPKTAAFFLAFIPQFVDPAQGDVALQFVMLGLISVALNTLTDVVVALTAARARDGLARRPNLIRRLREASGLVMCSLGGLARPDAPHGLRRRRDRAYWPSHPPRGGDRVPVAMHQPASPEARHGRPN